MPVLDHTRCLCLWSTRLKHFELSEDDPNFFVPEVRSSSFVLQKFHIAVDLNRSRVIAQELDLFLRNTKGSAESHQLGVAGVETSRDEDKGFRKGTVAEGVDVGVVHREEQVPGLAIDHGNLGEFRNVVPGDDHVKLVVAVAAATRLRKPMRANAHVAPVWMWPAERARCERFVLHDGGHGRACDRAVPVEENTSSVRAVTFSRWSAKDIVSSNIVLVVKTGFEEYCGAYLNNKN